MGQALANAFVVCRESMAEADAALGEPLSRLCFEGPEDQLTLTENTQPAILAVSIAAYRLLVSRGVSPVFVAGHSLGEYSANVAAGTFSLADALRTVRRRGRYMQEAVAVGAGAMAAILGLEADRVAQACEEAAQGGVVSPANINGAGQVVIAGDRDAVARAGERAKALGARRVIPLAVSAPFHCALMKPAQDRLAPELRTLPTRTPVVPVVANVDAEPKREVAAARGDHAADAVADVVSKGGHAEAVSLDVTDAAAVERLPEEIVARHGRLDIVVSNAGIARDQLLMRMKRDDWDAVLATNLTATFLLAQAAMRPMLKQRGGRIIAISSVVGQMGNAGQTNYAASKAGLIGFAKALAREVASRSITVNVVAPGMVDTDMTRAITEKAQVDWASQIPLGRLGTSDDVAAAVCFLASDEASYITGHVLAVNGGMYM